MSRRWLLLSLLLSVCAAQAHEVLSPEQYLDRAKAFAAPELIDVRTPEEFAQGHIQGAINLPLDTLPSQLAALSKDRELVIYCRSGRRAKAAITTLEQAGFTHLSELDGSILRWQQENRPLVTSP